MYEYRAELVRVIDGDTIVVNMDLGLDVWVHDVHLRLRNIDAPEVRTRDAEEKERGLASKQYLENVLAGHRHLVVATYKDKTSFNRYVADVMAGEVNVCPEMVRAGHASWSLKL